MQPIILASRSPRRRQLLEMLGVPYTVVPAAVDERRRAGEDPAAYAIRVAVAKAQAVAESDGETLVLGADTTVVLGDETLGKPASPAEAATMLARLSGRTHSVISAVAVVRGARVETAADRTAVTFQALDAECISDYVATGESLDKAGAYGIQGYGAALVRRIDGDFFGVMGLPIRLVLELLERFGQRYHFTR